MYDAINALLVIFVSATTALFYLRVCAVYRMSKIIIVVYGMLWLSVVGMLLTIPFTFTAAHIATTQYCAESVHGHLLGPTTIIIVVNHAMIYAAITYRIFSMLPAPQMAPNSRFCLRSGRLFPTSRVFCSETANSTSCEWSVRSPLLILLTFYDRVVIVTNPFIVACVYVFKPPVSIMFLVCHLLFVNILSNRVYRNIKTELVPDVAMPPVLSRPSEPLVFG